MKHLKTALKLLVLLTVIGFMATGCQKEDITNHHSNRQAPENPPFKVHKIFSDEISKNKSITNTLKSFEQELTKNRQSSQNKEVYSSEFDFTIETDYATYIENEDGSYHSYTFPIIRTEDNGLLENLLLSLKPDGSYKTFMVT